MISEWTRHTLVIEQLERAHTQVALEAATLRGDRTPSGPRLTVAGLAEAVRRLIRWYAPAPIQPKR